jgi:hypothetical protein
MALALLVVAGGPATARAQAPGVDGLARWADRYPSDRVAGREFWNDPAVAQSVARLLGPERYRLFRQMDVESQVHVADGFLSVFRCQPHNCPNQATLLIDLRTGAVVVCYTRAAEVRTPGRPPETQREMFVNSTLSDAPSRTVSGDDVGGRLCPYAQQPTDMPATHAQMLRYVPTLRPLASSE